MKKRAKRTVSAVTALCLAAGFVNTGIVLPVNSGVVFAEPYGSAERSVSKAMRVTRHSVTAPEPVSLTNGMITLYYESDKLSVKNVEVCSQMSGMIVDVNKTVPGKIVIGFASVKPVEVSGDLFYVDYEYEAGLKEIPQFGLKVNELETEDSEGNTVEVDKGSVISNGVRSCLFLSTSSRSRAENCFKETFDEGCIRFGLQLAYEPLSVVTNGECTVKYDPEVMQFVSVRERDDIIVEANETEPGTIKLAFVLNEARSDGFLTDLVFRPLKNTVSDIYLITNQLTAVFSEDYILDSAPYYNDRFRFGIDVPELSDGLKNNRKATYRLFTGESVPVTNGMITVRYNENVEFKDIKLGEALDDAMTDINTSTPGKIVIGFASMEPIDLNGVFADIDFAFPAGLSDALLYSVRYEVNELETETSGGNVLAVDPKSVKAEICRAVYDMELVQENASDDVTAVIKLKNDFDVTNGRFTLDFDPELVEFSGVSAAKGQKGLLVDANETAPGKVKCVFISKSPVSADSDLLCLKFKPLKSGFSQFIFDPLELNNTVSMDDIYEYYLYGSNISDMFNVQADETVPAVTTAEAPVTTEAPVTSAEPAGTTVKPAETTVKPASTTVVEPVTSEAPVTSAGPVNTTVNPAVTTVKTPVTSEAPSTSAEPAGTTVKPAETTVKPASTTVVKPVTSEAPVTSAGPVNTTVAPVTTTKVNPVTTEAPATSPVPAVTTVKVNPVTTEAPATSPVPAVTTVKVNPVTTEAPATTSAPFTIVTDKVVPPVTTSVTTPAPVQNNKTGSVRIGSDDKLSLTNGKIILTYDPDIMTCEGVALDSVVAQNINEISTSEPGKIVIGFKSVEPIEIGRIADVQFRYADSITDPASLCSAVAQKFETVDETGTVIPVAPSSVHISTVTEAAKTSGDVNGDGAITTRDIVVLMKTILGELAPTVNSDVNDDGKTDAADLVALRNIFLG